MTSPPAPAAVQTFDYKPSSSMTGIKDISTVDAADRDTAVRSPYPVAAFGFGGRLLTSFPSTHAQGFYGNGGASVKIQNISDIAPRPMLEHFPGPLFVPKANPGKAKKDALDWLDSRLAEVSKETSFHRSAGREEKRQHAEDMLLLLRVLKAMIDHDGKILGS